MPAPNKEERAKCWEARDGYWNCLEENNENKAKCSVQRTQFEQKCVTTWVKYFDRRRDYLKYKDKIQNEGYEPVDSKNT